MKKIFSLIVIAAAVAMVSCCGNKKAATEVEATEVEATTEVVEEAACCEKCDSCCEKCEAAEATEEVVEEAAAETVEEAK